MANRIGIDVVIGTLFHGRALGKAQSEILGFAAKTSAALAGVGIVSGKLATDFEKGFAQVNTIVGLTGKEFDKLRAGALAVAADSSFAIGDLNKALFDLVSAGVPATNAIDALRLSSEAATAGAASLSDAVNAGISVVNAFGLEASDLSDVFDVQFATVKRGVTTFQELAAFQGQLIPQATALGVSFKEMFGALGFLTTQGQRTRIAVSGLGNAFVSMAQQEEKLRKEGIRLFDAQTGQFRGLVPVVADFQRRLEGLSDAQKSAFFADVNLSQEAQRAIVPMINQFLRFRDTVTDVADESGGAMEDA
ncbi:MAG: phage tail tape measure protein, partial [Dehalococcoidia bacterium]